MNNEISHTDDIIDVRDVIARVEELREERDDLTSAVESADEVLDGTLENHDALVAAQETLTEWQTDNAEELATLEELLSDLCGNGGDEQWEGDWYPVTLIRDSYFTDAMQELCEDIGDMPRDGFPSYMVIDWEATARNLQVDYSSVEFNGVTYWYR